MTRHSLAQRWLVGFALALLSSGGFAQQEDAVISEGKTVGFEYTLSLSDGTVVESNVGGDAFTYTQGQGQILPALEQALLGMAVDWRRRRPILGNVTGGLSGPAIKPVALALLWKVRQAVDVPIMGLGGIATAEDALEFLVTGATAVQVGTTTFVEPGGAVDIVTGIEAECAEAGLTHVSELVGTLSV